MSVYKVERKVDTVIMHVDIAVAEQLVEILDLVQDSTRRGRGPAGSSINDLRVLLREDADVRSPSPLYYADAKYGYVLLTDRIRVDI